MAASSIDLRQKILHTYERRLGLPHALAHVFGVSLAFGETVLRQHRTIGTIAPKPHAGGQKPHMDEATYVLLRQQVCVRGTELAKLVLLAVGMDYAGHVELRTRSALWHFIATLPPRRPGMAACGSAPGWARWFRAPGHDVR
jgi:transposase